MREEPVRQHATTRFLLRIDQALHSHWGTMAMIVLILAVTLAHPPVSLIGSAVLLGLWGAVGYVGRKHRQSGDAS
ncbi:hypothetical protein [Streptomyces sp. NPDC059017]|uniref:hypothetical protein n=1 Tax=unclassified Streptomyces TaxID=2593676 RepID=UPI0036A0B8BC